MGLRLMRSFLIEGSMEENLISLTIFSVTSLMGFFVKDLYEEEERRSRIL